MKWTLFQLNQLQHKGLEINETVDVSEITSHSDIRSVGPVHVTGRADLSSKKATFHLTMEGSMVLPCSRTLVDVDYPFTIKTTETFLFQPGEYESDDEELHTVEGDQIDLLPIIQESIILEVPMQIFSDSPDKEKSAPQSGRDWEVVTEEETKEKVDPRLAGLAKFFEKDKE
ncbi:YceD family protein [Sutcliffiella rhizosphaerae]|uniref:YceD family protein n=1 Tax=Sutcliffiella rhizosphaerae TaxID=2880967 RepID=UPI001E2C7292|nr:YceD family protein [Sutcliffiella rhizosphaerae]